MNQLRKCIATSALLLLALFAATSAWAAQAVGTVVNLNGPLLARKADGTVKVLAQKSEVHQGDTLVTENKVYARIRFIDKSEITLRPNSQFRIDNFSFDASAPQDDKAEFNLVKGGLRAVTGVLGQRSKERVGFNTPTATIGIRGTTFVAEYVPPSQEALAAYAFASMAALETATVSDAPAAFPAYPLMAQGQPAQAGRAPGLYVQVLDGMINLSNGGGSQNFGAGQFGYAPSFNQAPMILPDNPGMQFSPPPQFSASSGQQDGSAGPGSGGGVVCEVR